MPAPAFIAKAAVSALLLPPTNALILILAGLWCLRRRPWLGRSLIGIGVTSIYLLSTPLLANALMQALEPPPVSAKALAESTAIVCLGGGKRFGAYDEPGGEAVNNATLVRLRYCARLARQSSLPVLVSGGAPVGGIPEAGLMATTLHDDFGITARWVEAGSDDTADNARLSAQMLLPHYRRIILVSQAWHLPRAMQAYRAAGFDVRPAGTDYANREPFSVLSLLPKDRALYASSVAMRELIGQLWYNIRRS
ncbi:YdcF family protein [Jeongeupia naejangsanensis]|uniref:YdcF family protein n=1 Tax=Jeongeupia naejangsanensis TaxID=613195 RepID=A0ABS2BI90_9NEIS|nr:YdcF family protein [Jeongeupia naejangsanensis]MBM3114666.1 YdcF family protein [Jeongeupia naejangsanensis]